MDFRIDQLINITDPTILSNLVEIMGALIFSNLTCSFDPNTLNQYYKLLFDLAYHQNYQIKKAFCTSITTIFPVIHLGDPIIVWDLVDTVFELTSDKYWLVRIEAIKTLQKLPILYKCFLHYIYCLRKLVHLEDKSLRTISRGDHLLVINNK